MKPKEKTITNSPNEAATAIMTVLQAEDAKPW